MIRVLCLALIASICSAQAPAQPKRKTIGVALAGGAALGIAHVGVLQWLEQNRIPIDYIAGTSMGGLVGALYATGHNSEQTQRFLAGIDWNSALAQTPPFRQLSFRRKEDLRRVPTQIELGFKGRINLPTGLSAGHGVGLVLSRFTAPYSDLGSFDDLPTPFRCIATDLVQAKPVLFDKGSLFDALRATMSLPGIFSPVETATSVLVDGGLTNNLPVDVVKAMGADIVIAVALDKPPKPETYRSLLGIASRSISVMITDNERRNMGMADIVLMPNLEKFETSDYPEYEGLRQVGYESAEQKPMLKHLSISESEYAEYVRARAKKTHPENISPKFLQVEGNIAPKRLESLVATLDPQMGKPLDRGAIEDEMTRLTGLGRFDSAEYQFVRRDNEDGLLVKVHEKAYGPPFLRLGLLIDGSPDQGLRFGVGGRLIFLDTGGPASEWRTDFSVGQVNEASTEYYYRIRGGKWFVAPRAFYRETVLPYYEADRKIFDFKTRVGGGAADIGYAFGRYQEIRFGYEIGNAKTVVRTGPYDGELRGQYSGFRGKWTYDGQDNPMVPRRGVVANVIGNWMTDYPGMSKAFPAIEGTLGYARIIKGRYSFFWEGEGGTTTNDPVLSTTYFTGGLFKNSALARGQYLGNHFYHSGLYFLRNMSSEQLALFGRFYIALGWEAGNAWTDVPTPRPYNNGLLGFMGETPLGLVFFGGAIGERGEKKILLRVGRYF